MFCGGKRTGKDERGLRGTRMPVSLIFDNLEAGADIDDIVDWYDGLDREQIKAVIEFVARSLDEASASRR